MGSRSRSGSPEEEPKSPGPHTSEEIPPTSPRAPIESNKPQDEPTAEKEIISGDAEPEPADEVLSDVQSERSRSRSAEPRREDKEKSRSRERETRRRHDSPERSRRHRRDSDRDDRRRSRDRSGDRHRTDRRDRDGRRERDRDDDRGRRHRRDRESPSPKRGRKERSASPEKEAPKPKEPKEPLDLLRTRAGGAYIPPAKLKMMQEQIQDKNSEQYQRMDWERLKKKIHGLVNKINVSNLVQIVRELLQENIIRGKGLLARSIIQAQAFSPGFSHVYAALVAVINSKFPQIGELILKRLIVQFKRSFRRNDKASTVTVSKFIAHLINQQVAHEILSLEIMLLMLHQPTDDSVEVTISFLKECGAKLSEIAPRALDSVFSRLRNILAEAELETRTRYMIEVAMAIRKDKFQAHPAVTEDLDLISEEDQITHTLELEDAVDPENMLNIFKLDENFEKNETAYQEIRENIVGDAEDGDDESDDDEEEDEEGEEGAETAAGGSGAQPMEIIDNTEQNLVAFRREVYLTIQSSLDYQEAAHKLLKMRVKKELEPELCHMLVDCCAQQRSYARFYGLLCERFCRLRRDFQATFEQIVRDTYATIHRFDITKLRNMACLASHLLSSDAIGWTVLSDVKLNENDTTSSGRIYLKHLFTELASSMGIVKIYERTIDPTLQTAFAGLFPRDNPANTRFAINFFTLIGLGGLTIDLRKFLEKGAKKRAAEGDATDESSSSSSSSDSSDSDSDSSSSSSSSSSDSDSEDDKKKKKKKRGSKKQKKSKGKKGTQSEEELSKKVESVKVKAEPESREGSPAEMRRRRRRDSEEQPKKSVEREERRKEHGDRREERREEDVDTGRRGKSRRDEGERRDVDERKESRRERSRDRSEERDERKEKTRERSRERSVERDDRKERRGERSRDRGDKENRHREGSGDRDKERKKERGHGEERKRRSVSPEERRRRGSRERRR